MGTNLERLSLGIQSDLVNAHSINFRLPSWPPPPDFPIVVDSGNRIISKFSDEKWDVSCWAKKPLRINFGDGPQRKGAPNISKENANMLRVIAAWMLWGPRSTPRASTFANQIKILRPLFILCSQQSITVDLLSKYPAVMAELVSRVRSVHTAEFIRLLHLLYEQRNSLGFSILGPEQLRQLAGTFPKHCKRQTAYIPPRIWSYQVRRLREFLDEYHTHRHLIENCYEFCIDAYINNFGSIADAKLTKKKAKSKNNPFITSDFRPENSMARSYGAFSETAARFEIANLLTKWCEVGKRGLMISTLTRYMRMVVEVGCAYLLNFSMMRIEECWRLRCDCYQEEDDPNFGKICFLRGSTTKTIQDDDARWITSPAAKIAVDAMASLARLRTRILGPGVGAEFAENDIHNPYLALSAAEPWTAKSWKDSSLSRRHTYPSYLTTVEESPRLFDQDELKITEEDIRICRLVTPDLNTEIYKVGKIWPLAWHQLRRTGAVNMQASGLVSDGSIQYQLKHATRAMSLYYGQGFSHVRLNESARAEYVKVMYEVQGLSIAQLFSDRYVSPYGNAHKTEMLKIVSEKDHKSLCEAAQSGEISWRETLLGGCTKRGPCTYGGIENITRCGGGDGRSPCNFALFDKQKISQMERLASLIELRLAESSRYSPYNDALTAQKTALENALYVTKK